MGKTSVLVTGSSEGGIGYALCKSFDQAGCTVFASARRLSAMESLPSHIKRVELDVLSVESCQKAVERFVAESDPDARLILVNNAGAAGTGPLAEFDVDKAKAVYDVNVFAPMRLAQLVIPHMAKRRSGLIINIGSIVGNIPTPWAGVYASSKAALHAYSEVLHQEVTGFGITVMLVAPGSITSGFGKKQMASIELKPDSMYQNVRKWIELRANISQARGNTTPAADLANGITQNALARTPPAYYTGGGLSTQFWLLQFLPRWVVWKMMSRRLGTREVGLAK